MANVTVTRFPLGHIPWNKGLVGVQVSTRKGKKCRKHTDEEWSLYPELRYAIDNGRTLCKPCHMKTETYPRSLLGGVN